MHELSITRNIVAIVAENARGRTVKKVHLDVGRISGIEIPAIEFCWGVVTEGTSVEGAELVVNAIDGRAHCSGCDEDIELDRLSAVCPCERHAPIQIIAGEELLVRSMEV